MKALVLDAESRTALVRSRPKPAPLPHEVRIRVGVVALKPVDALYMYNPLASSGRVLRTDFAGYIDALGEAVPIALGNREIGCRVAGFVQGACSVNERPGAAAEYVVTPWDLIWRVQDTIPLADAASISLCALTAAQALFYRMAMHSPFDWAAQALDNDSGPLLVFIYGSSTSVGLYAAQLVQMSAKASRRRLILLGTASQKHFNMLKAEPYSYDELVDYRNKEWPAQLLGLTKGGQVDYAYDCISEGSTVSETCKLLSSTSKMAIVRSSEGGAWTAQDLSVEPSYGAVWEGLGEEVLYQGMDLPASPKARKFTVAFPAWLSQEARLRANPIRQMPGGLERIAQDGLRLLGAGSMKDRHVESDKDWMRPLSAEKIVYCLSNKTTERW